MENITRVIDIFNHQLTHANLEVALAQKMDGKWITHSTADFKRHVDALSLGMLELGIQPGDKVAIISFNRPEWNFVDFAVQQIGAISVPMYPTITVEDYQYIFEDAGVRLVFVQNQELAHKVKVATESLKPMLGVYTFDNVQDTPHWTEVEQRGAHRDIQDIKPLTDAIQPQDLFTLIYTSGTTGKPKGVMISHQNMVSNVESCMHLMPVEQGGRVLSFLPLCHVFERMISNVYIRKGLAIYYAQSMDTIGENIKEVKPQMFSTVPRLLEKVYDKIMAKGAELTGLKKSLFFWAVGVGQRYEINKNQGVFYNLKLSIANKLIFNKWREALGGQIKTIVSGSAPLQPRLATIFWSAGIPIMEGYGLTETSPVISVNEVNPKFNRIGTVGRIIKGVTVKIAEDGEILVKGPNVMMGYYNKPEVTAQNIKDGWLHTGDIGEFVQGEYLKITDRKKEMFKTSGGKYVAPAILENKFKESVFIEQIMVVGEGQRFPSALVVPNFEILEGYLKHKKISYSNPHEMVSHAVVLEKFDREIERLNGGFAQYEKVKKISILAEPWSIEGGELTPTMKLKRKAIKQKYAAQIENIYC